MTKLNAQVRLNDHSGINTQGKVQDMLISAHVKIKAHVQAKSVIYGMYFI